MNHTKFVHSPQPSGSTPWRREKWPLPGSVFRKFNVQMVSKCLALKFFRCFLGKRFPSHEIWQHEHGTGIFGRQETRSHQVHAASIPVTMKSTTVRIQTNLRTMTTGASQDWKPIKCQKQSWFIQNYRI